MSTQFQAALTKLIDDEQYRSQVTKNPQRIVSDFGLTGTDLRTLMSIGRSEEAVRAKTPGGGCSCSQGVKP